MKTKIFGAILLGIGFVGIYPKVGFGSAMGILFMIISWSMINDN